MSVAGNTFAQDIIEAAKGEPIEAIVIRDFGGYSWGEDDDPDSKGVPAAMRNRRLTWDEARPLLNYTYDTGYGEQDCHDFYAWTATHVLLVHEYDGSTYVQTVPRNPEAAI